MHAGESTGDMCKRTLKYIILTIGFFAMAACNIWAFLIPMFTIEPEGSAAMTKAYVWEVCGVLKSDPSVKNCMTYTDAVQQSTGLPLCPEEAKWLDGTRGAGIVSIILFVLGAFFCIERICGCIPRLRQGLLNYVHKLCFIAGLGLNFTCFVMVLLFFTKLPDDCVGKAPKDQPNSKIGGSAFLFMTGWICCILFFIMDVKWKDVMDSGVVSEGVQAGSPAAVPQQNHQQQYGAETQSMSGFDAPNSRNNSQFSVPQTAASVDDANYKI